MAVGTIVLYEKNLNVLSLADLLTATVKMGLYTSSYTPDGSETGHSVLTDLGANEITATGGYAASTITTDVATAVTNGYKYSSDNVVWTATGGDIDAWRYGVLYVSGALWGLTSPLIGYFIGDDTPANVPATTSGNTLTITVPAAGWFTKLSA